MKLTTCFWHIQEIKNSLIFSNNTTNPTNLEKSLYILSLVTALQNPITKIQDILDNHKQPLTNPTLLSINEIALTTITEKIETTKNNQRPRIKIKGFAPNTESETRLKIISDYLNNAFTLESLNSISEVQNWLSETNTDTNFLETLKQAKFGDIINKAHFAKIATTLITIQASEYIKLNWRSKFPKKEYLDDFKALTEPD